MLVRRYIVIEDLADTKTLKDVCHGYRKLVL
jgi:hypothetical protein